MAAAREVFTKTSKAPAPQICKDAQEHPRLSDDRLDTDCSAGGLELGLLVIRGANGYGDVRGEP